MIHQRLISGFIAHCRVNYSVCYMERSEGGTDQTKAALSSWVRLLC